MSSSPSCLNLSLSYERHSVRCVGTQDRPEWIAADLGEVLGIKNVRQVLAKFDEDEAGVCTTYTSGQAREMVTVTEPGLYRLIGKSRKSEAKKFQRWVHHEVLPCIRKHGMYPAPAQASQPEFVQVPAKEWQRLVGAVEHLLEFAGRQAQLAPVHIPTNATPRTTVQERLRIRWPEANKKGCGDVRALIRRQANIWLALRHSETPDVSGGPGAPCIYYHHQIAILDEAIDCIRDGVKAKLRDEEKRQPTIPYEPVRKAG